MAKAEAPAPPRELAPPEVGYRNREIHAPVGKFTTNLHVTDPVVEAEKHRLQTRAKNARLFVVRRPSGGAPQEIQRPFVLQ